MAWQDIKTAPKDGTRILVAAVIPTHDEDTGRTEMERHISVAYWLSLGIGGWWQEYPARTGIVQGMQVTHWMPLPAMPAAAVSI